MIIPKDTSLIVPQAFRLMELTPPSSMADDTDQARDAATEYEAALRMCLEAHDWSFARRVAVLPVAQLNAGEAADPDLPYVFTTPADFVAMRLVQTAGAWRQDQRYIRASIGDPLTIRYTAISDDERQLPATFRLAVATQLAALLSPRWVESRTRQADLLSGVQDAIAAAKTNDAKTASPDRMDGMTDDGDWVSWVLR